MTLHKSNTFRIIKLKAFWHPHKLYNHPGTGSKKLLSQHKSTPITILFSGNKNNNKNIPPTTPRLGWPYSSTTNKNSLIKIDKVCSLECFSSLTETLKVRRRTKEKKKKELTKYTINNICIIYNPPGE